MHMVCCALYCCGYIISLFYIYAMNRGAKQTSRIHPQSNTLSYDVWAVDGMCREVGFVSGNSWSWECEWRSVVWLSCEWRWITTIMGVARNKVEILRENIYGKMETVGGNKWWCVVKFRLSVTKRGKVELVSDNELRSCCEWRCVEKFRL